MNLPVLYKYTFKIRTKTGVLVDNLQISALSLQAAERNLKQMYVKCEVIDVAHTEALGNDPLFEDVLNIIVKADDADYSTQHRAS